MSEHVTLEEFDRRFEQYRTDPEYRAAFHERMRQDEAKRRGNKPCIELAINGLAPMLLVPYPSGVLYTAQTGGTACHHPEIEGVLLLFDEEQSVPLASLLAEHQFSCCRLNDDDDLLTSQSAQDADTFDRYFAQVGLPLMTNRAKLAESEEAWLHVLIAEQASDIVPHEFYGKEAVFIWQNCD